MLSRYLSGLYDTDTKFSDTSFYVTQLWTGGHLAIAPGHTWSELQQKIQLGTADLWKINMRILSEKTTGSKLYYSAHLPFENCVFSRLLSVQASTSCICYQWSLLFCSSLLHKFLLGRFHRGRGLSAFLIKLYWLYYHCIWKLLITHFSVSLFVIFYFINCQYVVFNFTKGIDVLTSSILTNFSLNYLCAYLLLGYFKSKLTYWVIHWVE